jgi:hypothetical protein
MVKINVKIRDDKYLRMDGVCPTDPGTNGKKMTECVPRLTLSARNFPQLP